MAYTALMGRKPLHKERIDITLPKGMADLITDIAAKEGKNRSDFIADAMRAIIKGRGRIAELEAAAEAEPAPKSKRKRGVK